MRNNYKKTNSLPPFQPDLKYGLFLQSPILILNFSMLLKMLISIKERKYYLKSSSWMKSYLFSRINVAMYYDQSFKSKYVTASESVNAMRRVVAQAQNLYIWPSLTTKVQLKVVKEQEIKDIIEADVDNL
jgi:hypothetical protein